MLRRFARITLSGVSAAAVLIAASTGMSARAEPQSAAEAPAKPARPAQDRTRNLDFLFGALKAAPDPAAAKLVENRIMALWLVSGSDTADLLMSRVKTAMEAQDLDLAIRLLDSIVEIKPDYVEAWNRRATLNFMKKEYGQSLADIRQVLAREPRHFGALAGLGMILQEIGEDKKALEAFRRALEIDPHLQKIPEFVKALTDKVEGRAI